MHRHKNGWRVSWYESGKKREKKFKDPAEAQLFELQLKMGLLTPPQAKPAPTFEEFALEYHKSYSKADKVESTRMEDKVILDIHLLPHLGPIRISQVKRGHLLALRSKLVSKNNGRGKPLSHKRINNVMGLAKRIMNVAVDFELIADNPFRSVKPLKVATPSFDFWTVEERDKFIWSARLFDPAFTDLVEFSCHTGIRKGESRALRRRHLDFERRKIRVEQAYSDKSKKIQPTKNKDTADVPMNQSIFDMLQKVRDKTPDEPVFEERLFKNVHRNMKELCQMVEVKRIRFHDLRHTFASTLAMAGVDLVVVQKLMRHKSIGMTMRYAHLSPDHLTGQTDRIACGGQLADSQKFLDEYSGKSLKLWRTLRDSNSRPSGSKCATEHSMRKVG